MIPLKLLTIVEVTCSFFRFYCLQLGNERKVVWCIWCTGTYSQDILERKATFRFQRTLASNKWFQWESEQRPFRAKGSVVIFGLTRLLMLIHYVHLSAHQEVSSCPPQRGGGGVDWVARVGMGWGTKHRSCLLHILWTEKFCKTYKQRQCISC